MEFALTGTVRSASQLKTHAFWSTVLLLTKL